MPARLGARSARPRLAVPFFAEPPARRQIMSPRSCGSAVEAPEARTMLSLWAPGDFNDDGLMEVTAITGVEYRRAARLELSPGYRRNSMRSPLRGILILTAAI